MLGLNLIAMKPPYYGKGEQWMVSKQHIIEVVGVIDSALEVIVRDAKGRKILETKIRRSKGGRRAEVRFTRKPHGGALQIVWEKGKLVHLHCKKCNNEWKLKDKKPLRELFSVTRNDNNILIVKCKKCGQEYLSG